MNTSLNYAVKTSFLDPDDDTVIATAKYVVRSASFPRLSWLRWDTPLSLLVGGVVCSTYRRCSPDTDLRQSGFEFACWESLWQRITCQHNLLPYSQQLRVLAYLSLHAATLCLQFITCRQDLITSDKRGSGHSQPETGRLTSYTKERLLLYSCSLFTVFQNTVEPYPRWSLAFAGGYDVRCTEKRSTVAPPL